MSHDYTLFGWLTLESGSWADWFSGTMSASAVMTALAAFPLANRQRRKEQRIRDKEVSRAVGWKLLKMLNATADISRHFGVSLAQREPTFPAGYKFPLVRPLGMPDRLPQELNQEETEFLLKAQAPDLLAEIDMCFGRYASIAYGMNEYKNRHEALFELMPAPIASERGTFTHSLSPEEAKRVRPYTDMLEALINSLIAMTDENLAKAHEAMAQYQKDMERYLGKSPLEFEFDPKVAAMS